MTYCSKNEHSLLDPTSSWLDLFSPSPFFLFEPDTEAEADADEEDDEEDDEEEDEDS